MMHDCRALPLAGKAPLLATKQQLHMKGCTITETLVIAVACWWVLRPGKVACAFSALQPCNHCPAQSELTPTPEATYKLANYGCTDAAWLNHPYRHIHDWLVPDTSGYISPIQSPK